MASFDVESFFTNISLQETIDLCVDLLFNDKTNIVEFNKTDFDELLTVTFSESLILFNNEYYKQIDEVGMGFPLGPTFANIFVSYYVQIWLKNYPYEFKPVIYKRYVDSTFLLLPSKDHIEKFSEVTLIANMLILSLHLKQKKTIPYPFSILKLVGLIMVFLEIFIGR